MRCHRDDIMATGTEEILLESLQSGIKINKLLGNYGLYRPLYICDSLAVNDVKFKLGDVLITGADEENIFPTLL
jgi:hypothetical protein